VFHSSFQQEFFAQKDVVIAMDGIATSDKEWIIFFLLGKNLFVFFLL